MKVLNVRLLVILLICGVILGVGVYFLHNWQVHRNADIYKHQADAAEKRAEAAEKNGQFAEAIAERRTVAKNLGWYVRWKPKDIDTLERLGFLLSELSDYRGAFKTFERLLRLDASRTKARRELVNVALAIRRFPHARAHLEEYLLKANPNDPELLELLGKCQESMLDFDKAVASYEQAIELDPKQVSTYGLLADLLRKEREQDEEADSVMRKLVGLNPDSVEAHLAFGRYLRKYDRNDEAMEEALAALKLGPDDPDALWLAARCALGKRDFKAGRKYAKRGIELHPDYIGMYTALADIELQAERWEAAIDVLKQGLAANEDHQQLLWSMANLLIDTGQIEEAEKIVGRLDSSGYPPTLVGYLRARIAFTRGEWLAACQGFEQVRGNLSLMPDLVKKVNLWLGKAYGKLGNTDQQIAAYRRALSTDRFFTPARLGIAEALLEAGRLDEAIAEYAHLRDRKQTILGGAIPWARMQILRTLRTPPAQRDWTIAERALEEAARLVPDSVEIPVLRVEILVAQGRVDEAEALLIRACDEKPEEVEFWRALASLAQRQENWDRVEQILDESERRLGDKAALRTARAQYLVRRYGKEAAEKLRSLAEGYEKFSQPERLELWQGLLNVSLQVGDTERTEQLCRQIIKTDPNNVEAHFRLFELAMRAEDAQGMKRVLQEIERIEHGPLWLYGQAVLLSFQAKGPKDENLDRALSLLAQAGESRPTWSRIPLLAGAIYKQKGKLDEELENNLKAIKLGSQNPTVIRRTLELLVYREQRLDEAHELIQRFNTIPPELLPIAREIYQRRGDLPQALDAARKAAAESDNYREHVSLAQILMLMAREAVAQRNSTETLKRYEEAEKALRKAAELGGENAVPWVALVEFLANTKQRDKAAKVLEQVKARVPAGQADLALAQCYEALGDVAKAKPLYEKALGADPANPLLIRAVVSFYIRTGQAKLAEAQLRRIIDGGVESRTTDVIWARRRMASLLDKRGNYRDREEGIRLLRENLKSGKSTFEDRLLLARLVAKGPGHAKREEAIDMFESMMRERYTLPPDDLFVLARLYLAKDDRSKTRDTMQKLLASHGSKAEHVAQYIHTLLKCEDFETAKWWLSRLEELAPRSLALACLRAEFLIGKEEYDKAIEVLLDFLETREPQSPGQALQNHVVAMRLEELSDRVKGDNLAEIRNRFREESEKQYRQLVADQPAKKILLAAFLARDGRFEEALGIIESEQNTAPPLQLGRTCGIVMKSRDATPAQQQRAEKVLQNALKRSDRPDSLLLITADAYIRLGRYDVAEDIYRKAIEENPQHAVAMNNLAVLLALQKRQLDEALKLINKALEIAGPEPAMIDSRATVYIAMGESNKALDDIKAALADAETPVRFFHLAQIYNLAGRPKSAVAAFTDAEESGLTADIVQPLELPAYKEFKAMQEKLRQEEE